MRWVVGCAESSCVYVCIFATSLQARSGRVFDLEVERVNALKLQIDSKNTLCMFFLWLWSWEHVHAAYFEYFRKHVESLQFEFDVWWIYIVDLQLSERRGRLGRRRCQVFVLLIVRFWIFRSESWLLLLLLFPFGRERMSRLYAFWCPFVTCSEVFRPKSMCLIDFYSRLMSFVGAKRTMRLPAALSRRPSRRSVSDLRRRRDRVSARNSFAIDTCRLTLRIHCLISLYCFKTGVVVYVYMCLPMCTYSMRILFVSLMIRTNAVRLII